MNISGEWLFIVNAAYTYILFYFVAKLFQWRIQRWRLVVVMMINSLVATLYVDTALGGIVSFLLAVSIAYIPNWLAFFQQGSILFLTTCFIGGFLTVTSTLFQKYEVLYITFILASIVLIALLRLWQNIKLKRVEVTFICEAMLTLFQRQLYVTAFYDSGNRCREPLSGQPVHFLAFDAIAPLLDASLLQALNEWDAQRPYDLSMFPQELYKKVRFVRIETVGQRHTVLAFRVEKLQIAHHFYTEHYVVLSKRADHFPQRAKLILQCSTDFQ